jgi:hypothetical protein
MSGGLPFTETEINSAAESLVALEPEFSQKVDDYKKILKECAHLSHKNWKLTECFSDKLSEIIGRNVDSKMFQTLFKRVLDGGNWNSAMKHRLKQKNNKSKQKPWVVLVTGLNGIRKTTSVYQPFFKTLLKEALVMPTATNPATIHVDDLPDGNNSFFRQLDYMLATLANNEFKSLYSNFSTKPVEEYSKRKQEIFSRYRMLAEMLGIFLMKSCKQNGMNVMVETSGRDVAMFKYIQYLFPEEDMYNKLVLHFSINDLKHAETSVDFRMLQEMKQGKAALEKHDRNDVIKANAGGPYGSKILGGVQSASDKVWDSILDNSAGVGDGWYKASFIINGNDDPSKWTIHADNNGRKGSDNIFSFQKIS